MEDWKKQSEELFFKKKMSIQQIASELNKTRKYISSYLNSIPGYQEERNRRKEENKELRKDSKREWDRTNRNRGCSEIDAAMLKNDHDQAVRELSHERYY